jgi:hypothetical protein
MLRTWEVLITSECTLLSSETGDVWNTQKTKDKTCDINDAIHANVNLHNGTGTTARTAFILVKE